MPIRRQGRCGLFALFLLALPAISPAQQIAMGEFAVPTLHGFPEEIAPGPDGALWFTEYNAAKIGRITTAGAITEYPVPTAQSGPKGITAGPDGALWFVEYYGNNIGRITLAGAITEYAVPTPKCSPEEIAAGPDGALWFTEGAGSKIGRITTLGAITEYTLPGTYDAPIGITAGPDGNLWFVEGASNQIGRITTTGTITEFPLPTRGSGPYGITVGPDGALWFTEVENAKIGRITTSGAITEFPVALEPTEITTGPDGALWFTEGFYTQIGRVTTAGSVTEYPLPRQGAPALYGITTGPDRQLWFANGVFGIGHIVFQTASLSVSPNEASCGSKLTFEGSAFAPNENVLIYRSGTGAAVLASGFADANGSFNAMAAAPQSVLGPRLFIGVGQNSGKLGAASFSMAPRLSIKPRSGKARSSATAEGCGFGSLEMVKIYWDNTSTILGTATSDFHGTFSGTAAFQFQVPADTQPGPHIVAGIGAASGAQGQGSFRVN